MIDLHVHTNCSDGELDVISVLERAEEEGIIYLSITDHDSVAAYKQLQDIDIPKYFTGHLINGIELRFLYEDFTMELLGYGVDIDTINDFKYVQYVSNLDVIKLHSERLDKIRSVCDNLGIKYSKDLMISSSNYLPNDVLLDDIIQYQENKEILDKMGIVDRKTFFELHYRNSKSPFYIDDLKKNLPTIQEVAYAIRNAGGKCFLAHIFKYSLTNPKEVLQKIIELNVLDGIECFHKNHSVEQAKYLEQLCTENHLLISGGSDFHRKTDCLGYYNKYQDVIPERIYIDIETI